MKLPVEIAPAVHANLASIYEEVMWLAERPSTTPSAARAWYTHVAVQPLRRHVRRFTGKVSRAAATDQGSTLRLEHFMRMQTTLTQLVARHLKTGTRSAEEFICIVLEYEQVHVVTVAENYAAMKAKGDYVLAGIKVFRDDHYLVGGHLAEVRALTKLNDADRPVTQKLRASFPISPDAAKLLKANLRALVIGTLAAEPDREDSKHETPTITSPYETYTFEHIVKIIPVAIWFYDYETGRVYAKIPSR